MRIEEKRSLQNRGHYGLVLFGEREPWGEDENPSKQRSFSFLSSGLGRQGKGIGDLVNRAEQGSLFWIGIWVLGSVVRAR